MEKYFSDQDLEQLTSRYKANLINSIGGLKSVNMIGSINGAGTSNLSLISSVIHIGSNPALLGFILRPTTVRRDTYENILENGCYTINQVHEDIVGKAHYTSAKFDEHESEFESLQLTPQFVENYAAPFVSESNIKIGLRFESEHVLQNDCRLIIGKIEHLLIENSSISEDGTVDLEKINTVSVSGLSQYYSATLLKKYPYAKKEEIRENLSRNKKRSDNVVFNEQTNKYDAGLKKYNTNVGAPAIVQTDLTNWKNQGSSKVNHMLQTQFDEIKKQYENMLEIYQWNQKIYSSKFNFEPITGEIYHLYKSANQELFLSTISPLEWNKDHQGSFQLNMDRIFMKI